MPQTQDAPLIWRTSSYTDSAACVEWARPGSGALVRDTKDRERARVHFATPAWQAFVGWAAQSE